MTSPVDGRGCCIACGRYVGLHARGGRHVGDEVHWPRPVDAEVEYVGPGRSGLGMWWVRRGWVCSWPGKLREVAS